MNTFASAKRAREQDGSFEEGPQSAASSPTTTKALRLSRAEPAPIFCSLPPTCNAPHNQPTALANVSELEAHYAKYHAHVCAEKGCTVVFPNAKLLELHQTECHDPLALLKKERGEKIFACHLESCSRKFIDPKKRRLHLIQAHGFPKEYFFAVTNKGVGGLLKKWGEGASMVRGTWKARDGQGEGIRNGNVDIDIEDVEVTDEDDDSMDEEMLSRGTAKNNKATVNPPPIPGQLANGSKKTSGLKPASRTASSSKATDTPEGGLDSLTNSMSSLLLVPSSIRFGRGGKSALDAQAGLKRGKHEQNSRHCSSTNATRSDSISPTVGEADAQLSGHDISINIDGTLEALKSEAPLNISARTITTTDDTGLNHVSGPGRRARGGRRGGRGRGPGRGHGRGRG